MATFHGDINTGAIEQPIKYTYKLRQGGTTTRTWRGTQDQCTSLYNLFSNAGWAVELTQEGKGGIWLISATLQSDFNGEPNPITQWQIQPHAVEQSVLECTDRTEIASLPTSVKLAIEKSIKEGDSHFLEVGTVDGVTPTFPNAQKVYNLMAIGVEARQIFTPIISRTMTVSTTYNNTWTLTNVGKVLSKATLISSYNVPSYIYNLIPESSAVTTDTNGVSSGKGFLESHPSYQSVGDNKISISQEWTFDKWSQLLYDFI